MGKSGILGSSEITQNSLELKSVKGKHSSAPWIAGEKTAQHTVII